MNVIERLTAARPAHLTDEIRSDEMKRRIVRPLWGLGLARRSRGDRGGAGRDRLGWGRRGLGGELVHGLERLDGLGPRLGTDRRRRTGPEVDLRARSHCV
ncbi:MAG: hypothetical protein JWO67_6856 [Streptosporangiaceae bacterium]|jgi:hypothetical protein|nr:hypothetical protein [Streptosporangiaceae bacterium]